jgi:hypothetical protein
MIERKYFWVNMRLYIHIQNLMQEYILVGDICSDDEREMVPNNSSQLPKQLPVQTAIGVSRLTSA